LYGENPTVALRELIQNCADAIQARRRLQGREDSWGLITISLVERDSQNWLQIEDTGVGMSEQVLTGPLIDFGSSFWRSSLVTEEFPGLLATGMKSIGRFGIGFFSVFMLGSLVRVTSKRYDRGEDASRVLEFRDGTASRPILYPALPGTAPLDGGTRVEILLKVNPKAKEGLLGPNLTLEQLVGSLAPNIGTDIKTTENGKCVFVVSAGDWIDLNEPLLLQRIEPSPQLSSTSKGKGQLMRCLRDASGRVYGRAFIHPNHYSLFGGSCGCVTVGGLRATRLFNIQGVLIGECLTAARDSAIPSVPPIVLASWASDQADLILASNYTDEHKAMCAEIVLECGGTISNLPIACLGGEWLDQSSLRSRLSELEEIKVNFDGEFAYDEDRDSVLPRDFRDDFIVDDDILLIPKHRGVVLNINRREWPSMLYNIDKRHISNLAVLVIDLIANAFGPYCNEDNVKHEVGSVNGEVISREVTVYSRS
jgi:hypothetical protein